MLKVLDDALDFVIVLVFDRPLKQLLLLFCNQDIGFPKMKGLVNKRSPLKTLYQHFVYCFQPICSLCCFNLLIIAVFNEEQEQKVSGFRQQILFRLQFQILQRSMQKSVIKIGIVGSTLGYGS